jgi:hypothetical protein
MAQLFWQGACLDPNAQYASAGLLKKKGGDT